jgi:hypothetical protein
MQSIKLELAVFASMQPQAVGLGVWVQPVQWVCSLNSDNWTLSTWCLGINRSVVIMFSLHQLNQIEWNNSKFDLSSFIRNLSGHPGVSRQNKGCQNVFVCEARISGPKGEVWKIPDTAILTYGCLPERRPLARRTLQQYCRQQSNIYTVYTCIYVYTCVILSEHASQEH